MNLLDLFSGIGGFPLGMERAGIEIDKHYNSEVDKYAEQIYRYRFPRSVLLGDVRKIGNELGKIDVITGGFPCQAFSIAGKRAGFEDTRGTLFFEIERLARFYKPKFMVLENVKGLFSHAGGNTIRVILDKLRRLDYFVQLLLVNTVDFGIPQNRERCFFICTLAGERIPEIQHIREAKAENTERVNCIDANYYKGIDNHGQRSFVEVETLRTHKDGKGFRKMQAGICPTIPARAREDGSGQPVVCLVENQRNELREMQISPALQASSSGKLGQSPPVAVSSVGMINKSQNGRRIKDHGDPMFTLTARDQYGILDNTTIRRLTPVEYERLQDFPDDWTKYGINENGEQIEISDTQRYKTCGNSITVKIAEEIFKAIKEYK